jgi:hypothetical protein
MSNKSSALNLLSLALTSAAVKCSCGGSWVARAGRGNLSNTQK